MTLIKCFPDLCLDRIFLHLYPSLPFPRNTFISFLILSPIYFVSLFKSAKLTLLIYFLTSVVGDNTSYNKIILLISQRNKGK